MGYTCKHKCNAYKVTGMKQWVHYIAGKVRRCQICEIFIRWEGLFCPCCSCRLRTKGRNKGKAKRCDSCGSPKSHWNKNQNIFFIYENQYLCTNCFESNFKPRCDSCKTTNPGKCYGHKRHWYRLNDFILLCNKCKRKGVNKLENIVPTNEFYPKYAIRFPSAGQIAFTQ